MPLAKPHAAPAAENNGNGLGRLPAIKAAPTVATGALDMTKIMPAIQTLQTIEGEVNSLVKERTEEVRATLLALLIKQHAVFLGPPGAGKSYMLESFASRFVGDNGQGLNYWSWQFNAYSKPSAMLGAVSAKKLVEQDVEAHNFKNKFPEAEIALLDEIFRAGRVLELLLSMLNERRFFNGDEEIIIPLMSAFAATNMLAQDDDLEAVYDRFLLRLEAKRLSEPAFSDMIRFYAAKQQLQVSHTRMHRDDLTYLQGCVDSVSLSNAVLDGVEESQKKLKKLGLEFSERRWLQGLRLVQAQALLEGRATTDTDDLMILQHILWHTPDQRGIARKELAKLGNPANSKAMEWQDKAEEAFDKWNKTVNDPAFKDKDANAAMGTHMQAAANMKAAIDALAELQEEAAGMGRNTARIDAALEKATSLNAQIVEKIGIRVALPRRPR